MACGGFFTYCIGGIIAVGTGFARENAPEPAYSSPDPRAFLSPHARLLGLHVEVTKGVVALVEVADAHKYAVFNSRARLSEDPPSARYDAGSYHLACTSAHFQDVARAWDMPNVLAEIQFHFLRPQYVRLHDIPNACNSRSASRFRRRHRHCE